jgi:hypothetical protein
MALPAFTSTCSPAITASPGASPLRCEDVGLLAITVFDQGNEGGAVGIVFDALDLAGDIKFAPLEIDLTINFLVAAAAEAHRDAAMIVATAA